MSIDIVNMSTERCGEPILAGSDLEASDIEVSLAEIFAILEPKLAV